MSRFEGVLDQLDAIEAAGWKVNNLFVRGDGQWQANLRSTGALDARGRPFTEFAVAGTAAGALAACLAKIQGVVPAKPATPPVVDDLL